MLIDRTTLRTRLQADAHVDEAAQSRSTALNESEDVGAHAEAAAADAARAAEWAADAAAACAAAAVDNAKESAAAAGGGQRDLDGLLPLLSKAAAALAFASKVRLRAVRVHDQASQSWLRHVKVDIIALAAADVCGPTGGGGRWHLVSPLGVRRGGGAGDTVSRAVQCRRRPGGKRAGFAAGSCLLMLGRTRLRPPQ